MNGTDDDADMQTAINPQWFPPGNRHRETP